MMKAYYNQLMKPNRTAFIYTISSTAGMTYTLPNYGNADFMVDWGDGNGQHVTTGRPTHVYSNSGNYVITITGTMQYFVSNGNYNCANIISVQSIGNVGLATFQAMFQGCVNLTHVDFIDPVNYTINEASYMFLGCSSLVSIPNVPAFNNILNGYVMFASCANLVNATSSTFDLVTNAQQMFQGCSKLTTIQYATFRSVQNAVFMLQGCVLLNSLPVATFQGLTNGYGAMDNCLAFSGTGYSNLLVNMSSTTRASGMYFGAAGVKYNTTGQTAKNSIITTYGCTFVDGGLL